MKKGKALGISVAVIAVITVMGIASLPDEVLLESPTFEASENNPSQMIPMDASIIEKVVEEPVVEVVEEPVVEVVEEPVVEVVEEPVVEVVEEPVVEVVEEPVVEEPETSDESGESDGQVIKINIVDGVGARQR